MNKRIYLFLIPVFILLVLGCINIYKKIIWEEPTDGVTWEETPQGLKALKVEEDSPAYLHGIDKGDILYSINDVTIRSSLDLAKQLWKAESLNQKVIYEVIHKGDQLFPSFFLTTQGTSLIYFYLALIGLTTLAIGLIVLLNAGKRLSLPYIFFFLISLAFYCFHVFSPTGHLDILDNTFYWADKIAFVMFPPLLLHFFLIFPKRKKFSKRIISSGAVLYLPGAVLLLSRVFIHFSALLKISEPFISRYYRTLEKLDLFHFTIFTITALVVIIYDSYKFTDFIVKKQLKWVAYGLGLGIIPFSVLYSIPFMLGAVPSSIAELTVILQALIPLTFAYSISRYKLMDLEVILKKAVTLVSSYVVIAILYFVVSSQTKIFSENKLNALILGILAIILGATLFTPLKKLIQSLLDRVIYKRSYEYRKTLLSITQELSRERDLEKLSKSLLELISNALSLTSIALLLPQKNRKNTFFIQNWKGSSSPHQKNISLNNSLIKQMQEKDSVSLYSLTEEKKTKTGDDDGFSSLGFFHLLPLKVEDKLIGCLAMGEKNDNTYLNSEDWELLRTISSPVALALENAYLYDQAKDRAYELERLKDYSENIIESLTVGVTVMDQRGKIIGWNRVMEETFLQNKENVEGKKLSQVLGRKNYSAIFPSDTQKGFRLLSEISMDLPQGKKKIFDIAKTPLLDNKMNPYGTIIVFDDTTEKISLQQQLLTSEKLASLGLLSAGVAHEINTPLTGISSYVQMLQKRLDHTQHTKILKKIETQADRVGKIVKNLLNLARNPSKSNQQQINLKQSLLSIISLIDYKLKNMNIDLKLDLKEVNPIYAQEERLQQVFINIILNALDAMPDGGTLEISLFSKNEYNAVKITDTGVGIKSQHIANIFDPFFTTKGFGKGTGLGLSISYAIIKEHEGHIDVESDIGKGTTFTIFIPIRQKKKAEDKSLSL
ncbi:MAG: PDZ domain-containing protein [Candidatus Aminicenantes bacterium]|nr:PDZ domain-containing protein [Candidatus Aminicenantes bacterium]